MKKIAVYAPHQREWEPINLTRAVFEIKCGLFTFMERIENLLGERDSNFLVVPEFLKDAIAYRFSARTVNPDFLEAGDIVLWGDVVFTENLLETIIATKDGATFTSGGRSIATVLHDRISIESIEKLNLPRIEVNAKIPEGIWDIPLMNADQIIEDFHSIRQLNDFSIFPLIGSGSRTSRIELSNPGDIFISKETEIEPFVYLDASDGPVILGEKVSVKSGSIIRGPFFADRGSEIYTARITGGTTLGPVSRIGGEIEASVIQGYTNKYHDGFLGHAYLGEWVNLGAMTSNSDLKNNYSNVRYPITESQMLDTGRIKVGTFIGDHAKTGIGTLLNSGSNIGPMANVFGGGMTPKYIKPFSWGIDNNTLYSWEKARETALKVTTRRNVTLSHQEIDLLQRISEKFWKNTD